MVMCSAMVTAFATLLLTLVVSAQNDRSKCVEKLDQMMQCVEKVRASSDAQALEKKKDDILQKCSPDLPALCKAMKNATEQCQQKVAADQALQTLRAQVKQNVAACFERFDGNATSASTGSPANAAPSPSIRRPPNSFDGPFQGNAQDPCAPNESQMACIKSEMRHDIDARELGRRLDEKEGECATE